MQPNSIPEVTCVEHEHTEATFPLHGDNFRTVCWLPADLEPLALVEACEWLQDCEVALAEFERQQQCTGTPDSSSALGAQERTNR